MTFEKRTKKKDDELLIWAIVGGIFTALLVFIDFGYSSVNEMAPIARIPIWVGHGVLGAFWVVTIAAWKDPNFDYFRKLVVAVAVMLSLIIGLHHSFSKEDNQVIIDSKENAEKP